MNTKLTTSQAKVNTFPTIKNSQTQAQGQVHARAPTQANRKGEMYVPDDLESTMCGLEHWYKNCSQQIGALAAMGDEHPNRGHFVNHIKLCLERLIEAIKCRQKCGVISNDQVYDLTIMKKHVQQMVESVSRLA